MGKSSYRSSENLHDKFYTTSATAAACFSQLMRTLPELQVELFLEPSAGAGAFLSLLPEPRLGLDIEPDAPGIVKTNFFDWRPPCNIGRVVVIGNPPFGVRGAKAIKFFNHAAKFADVIAFIMPGSFMKVTMHRDLDQNFHLISELPFFSEVFLFENRLRYLTVTFQVWRRESFVRLQPTRRAISHKDFVFVKKLAEADLVVRRVGARAGEIASASTKKETDRGCSPNSNYFVKASGVHPAVLKKRFFELNLKKVIQQCVAVPSVSKADLVAHYESVLESEALRPSLVESHLQFGPEDLAA